MRPLLLGFALIAVVFLGLTVYQIGTSAFPGRAKTIIIDDLKGFSDTGPNGEELKKLREQFNARVTDFRDRETTSHRWWLIISFIVTGLTAASTLVSSIAAARNQQQVATKTVVIIAVLTFLATLGNWGTGQLSESKTKAVTSVQAVKDLRTKFFEEYQKTAEDKKAELIDHYHDLLIAL